MKIKKILVANRSEIAIRVFRAANELGLLTVAVYSREDKLALHRFKADEAYQIGEGKGPIEAYLSIDEILRVAREAKVDAIHPGYGFLAENPEFVERCNGAGIIFIGPSATTMRQLGDKVSARNLAEAAGVPVMPATPPLPDDPDVVRQLAENVGYPLMLKASWGGGGRGMRVITAAQDLSGDVDEARREARAAFGRDEVYLEKLVERARHVEVQVLGDRQGNLVHLFERDCSVQRRNQKIVERAPAPYLDDVQRRTLCGYALKIAAAANYEGAGTVEFLMDTDTGHFYFIEVNTRIQVEHTVTEEVTGIDIVKAQIRIAEGMTLNDARSGVPAQKDISLSGHALQCRITTEDPDENFIPDYGRITAYRGATGFGIRLDGGTAYSGAVITRYYDPLLEKVTAWAPSPDEAIARMDRALREFRIRGVATNLLFLENVVGHPDFASASYTTRFIDTHPELFETPERLDRATKLLTYIADVSVNGHPDIAGRSSPRAEARVPTPPVFDAPVAEGTRQRLAAMGASAFSRWVLEHPTPLVTDTTMRDAHQSLLATRMRTYDIVAVAQSYAKGLPQLFSLECWGGATFDVAMRFLMEDPWERLSLVREGAPNILLQMLLRGANGVGYKNYPDNVVRHFVSQAASAGVDVFRVFDCLNWVDNMRVAMDAVIDTGKICEGVICYTGDILDPGRPHYNLAYYLDLAKQLENAGAHIIGLKDMAGLLKPAAAEILIKALKQETGLPVHFHTHDTSGIAAASVLAAIAAGADIVDAAMDAMSGLTSQPCLGSIVEALRGSDNDTGLHADAIRRISLYWEGVRALYLPFESDLRAGASEVYLHEMPGGQFTNLKEQARSLGLAERWDEIAHTYVQVNDMFGDIVKVTPSSKVVGDMALMMVSSGLKRADVEDPGKDVAFPDSVVQLMRGDMGQPAHGFPKALQAKVLKGEAPLVERPGALLPPADLDAERKGLETIIARPASDEEFASYLMYPKVFIEFAKAAETYGPVSVLPTPVYLYGLQPGAEVSFDLETGKRLIVRCVAIGETNEAGEKRVFFELNGQPRSVVVPDRNVTAQIVTRRKAISDDPTHIAAPMPGVISTLIVATGDRVEAGDVVLSIEAMKMDTAIHTEIDGIVSEILIEAGAQVDAKDLLVIVTPDAPADHEASDDVG